MVSSNYSYLLIMIWLHAVILFQVFLSNTNNSYKMIWFSNYIYFNENLLCNG